MTVVHRKIKIKKKTDLLAFSFADWNSNARQGKSFDVYLNDPLMSFEYDIDVHLGALLRHDHDFCALSRQGVA